MFVRTSPGCLGLVPPKACMAKCKMALDSTNLNLTLYFLYLNLLLEGNL